MKNRPPPVRFSTPNRTSDGFIKLNIPTANIFTPGNTNKYPEIMQVGGRAVETPVMDRRQKIMMLTKHAEENRKKNITTKDESNIRKNTKEDFFNGLIEQWDKINLKNKGV